MNQLQDKVVYTTGWLNAGRLAADWQFFREQMPINESQTEVFLKDARNISHAPVGGEAMLFFRPVPLYQEIVLDPELIAECRSGEI